MRAAALGLVAGLAIVGAPSASLAANDMVAAEQVSGTNVGFVLHRSFTNATLSVSGPSGFEASAFSPGNAVIIDLSKHGPLPDGTYNYQLTAASGERIKAKDNGGRGSGRKAFARKSAAKSGNFNVRNGRIVNYEAVVETSTRDQDPR